MDLLDYFWVSLKKNKNKNIEILTKNDLNSVRSKILKEYCNVTFLEIIMHLLKKKKINVIS